MKRTELSEKPWYNGAVIACIVVAFYVLLANFGTVLSSVRFFLGNFNSIVLGMLLSIPAAAILCFIYQDYFFPGQEMRHSRNKPI